MPDAPPAPASAPTPAAAPSFMSRFSGMVAAHPSAAFGVIVVLAVLVVVTLVYYRGLAFLGPYAGVRAGFAAAAVGGARPADAAAKADTETEQLIESINKS